MFGSLLTIARLYKPWRRNVWTRVSFSRFNTSSEKQSECHYIWECLLYLTRWYVLVQHWPVLNRNNIPLPPAISLYITSTASRSYIDWTVRLFLPWYICSIHDESTEMNKHDTDYSVFVFLSAFKPTSSQTGFSHRHLRFECAPPLHVCAWVYFGLSLRHVPADLYYYQTPSLANLRTVLYISWPIGLYETASSFPQAQLQHD